MLSMVLSNVYKRRVGEPQVLAVLLSLQTTRFAWYSAVIHLAKLLFYVKS